MRLEDLAGLPHNYDAVGATETGEHPAGYHPMDVYAQIGTGRVAYQRAADALLHWQVQQVAGIRLTASTDRVAVGANSLGRLGIGRLSLAVPCRVVWLTEEPNRTAYAYGTLAGHPESGEEEFEVVLDDDDEVWFTVTAFSRPAAWYAKLGGPVTRLLQRYIAGRYVTRLKRLANSPAA